jgi:hypothetical protein
VVITGAEGVIVKLAGLDVPPPGGGLTTVTVAVPAVAISAARIDAVNCVELTKVVARFELFHCTTEPSAPFTKLLPFTVRVKAWFPALRVCGDIEVRTGTELVTKKETPLDVPPPVSEFDTVMVAVPAPVIRLAGTAAVSCVGCVAFQVVVNPVVVPFHVQFTLELPLKLVPVTVSVKAALLASMDGGEI